MATQVNLFIGIQFRLLLHLKLQCQPLECPQATSQSVLTGADFTCLFAEIFIETGQRNYRPPSKVIKV